MKLPNMGPFMLLIVLSALSSSCIGTKDSDLFTPVKPPENVRVELYNDTTVKVNFDKPTMYLNSNILNYEVKCRQMLHEMIDVKNVFTKPPVTHVYLSGLRPHVIYNLVVYIHMKNRRNGASPLMRFSTSNPNATNVCLCDPYGSLNSTRLNQTCTPGLEKCVCRPNYTGSHCSQCLSQHFRQQDRPCEKCPCFENSSNGQCHYVPAMNRPVCNDCKKLLRGPLCELCVDGYYKKGNDSQSCVPCPCPKTASGPSRCTMFSGRCLDCPNGTMGDSCEICLPGWTGIAPKCVPSSIPMHSKITVITAFVVLLAVAISLVLGYWYMRVRARRKRLNAWSLELNRYEQEHPGGLVDSHSHAGLMMEEAPTAVSSRLQLRQSDVGIADEIRVKKGTRLV